MVDTVDKVGANVPPVAQVAPLLSVERKDDESDRKLQRAWQLFVSLEYQIQVADRKVQAVFGANALLVAALSLQSQLPMSQLKHRGFDARLVIEILLRLIFMGLVFVAASSAINALRPRVKPDTFSGPAARSLFFFGNIAAIPTAEYITEFLGLTNEVATMQILQQSHTVAAILDAKYRWMHRATSALLNAMLVWIVLQLIRFLG